MISRLDDGGRDEDTESCLTQNPAGLFEGPEKGTGGGGEGGRQRQTAWLPTCAAGTASHWQHPQRSLRQGGRTGSRTAGRRGPHGKWGPGVQ